MNLFLYLLLAASPLFSAALGGEKRFCCCLLLCLALCPLALWRPDRLPLPLRLLLLPGFLFLLFPFWPLFFAELPEARAGMLFALLVLCCLLTASGKRPFFAVSALPLLLLAIPLCLCVCAGEWDTAASEPVFSAVGCILTPPSCFLALPGIDRLHLPRTHRPSAVLLQAFGGVLCAAALSLPLLLFRSPLLELAACTSVSLPVMICLLRVFCGGKA